MFFNQDGLDFSGIIEKDDVLSGPEDGVTTPIKEIADEDDFFMNVAPQPKP